MLDYGCVARSVYNLSLSFTSNTVERIILGILKMMLIGGDESPLIDQTTQP